MIKILIHCPTTSSAREIADLLCEASVTDVMRCIDTHVVSYPADCLPSTLLGAKVARMRGIRVSYVLAS